MATLPSELLTAPLDRWPALCTQFFGEWLGHPVQVPPAQPLARAKTVPSVLESWSQALPLSAPLPDRGGIQLQSPKAWLDDEDPVVIAGQPGRSWAWGIQRADLVQDDPPVLFNATGLDPSSAEVSPWVPHNASLREFLSQWLIYTALLGCRDVAETEIEVAQRDSLMQPLSPLPGEPWHYPAFPAQFYEARDVIVLVHPSGPPWSPPSSEQLTILAGLRPGADPAFFLSLTEDWAVM